MGQSESPPKIYQTQQEGIFEVESSGLELYAATLLQCEEILPKDKTKQSQDI